MLHIIYFIGHYQLNVTEKKTSGFIAGLVLDLERLQKFVECFDHYVIISVLKAAVIGGNIFAQKFVMTSFCQNASNRTRNAYFIFLNYIKVYTSHITNIQMHLILST